MFLFIKSLATPIVSPITYNFNNFSLFLYLIIVTISSHTKNLSPFFNPQGTPLRVAALWRPLLPNLHKRKKSTTCSGANLTTVSVCGGICRALPFI